MSRFICPYCYMEHTLTDCGMKCLFNVYGTDIKCKRGVEKDGDGWIPQKDKNRCFKCTEAAKEIYCPTFMSDKGGFHPKIPFDFFLNSDGANLPIAMLGAKASGKSNYIAVLINEIRKKMLGSFRASLAIASSEDSLRNYNQYYYDPLYKKDTVIEATDAGVIPPLIFPLILPNSGLFAKGNKVVNLTFYDTAGENLDTADDMAVFTRYIPNAKGIILLLDPLQLPSVRAKLQGKVALPAENRDVMEILSRVIESVRKVKNISGSTKINIPLALVVTKLDVLETYNILPPDSCMREESEHLANGAFVWSDYENTNIEMQDLLQDILKAGEDDEDSAAEGELMGYLNQFTKYSVFGLSALGNIPKGQTITRDMIKPKRVLDPLLWLLAEHKYIKTIRR